VPADQGVELSTAAPSRPETLTPEQPSRPGPGIPRWMLLVLAIVAQAVFALAMKNAPALGLVHALGVFGVGLYAVALRKLPLVAYLCFYLAGSEVLWRQVRVPLPYLAAPYLLIGLSVFVVIVVIGKLGRSARIAIMFFLLLTPAIIATIRTAGEGSRELVAFALSGPLALAALVCFMSQVEADMVTYRRLLWTTLISAVGPFAIAVSDVGAALALEGSIEFSTASNFVTSGGFGPVQVSTVLGLGVLTAVILTLVDTDRPARVIAGVLAFALAVQSLLTFSRGGLFSTALALVALAVYRARDRRVRNRILGVAAVALTLGYFLVVPWIEDFTGGAFSDRFSDVNTERTSLAQNDTQIFFDNIVFGVGPGMTKYQRLSIEICELRTDGCRKEASSHTEFTRLLGEHGIAGVLALSCLVLLAYRSVAKGSRTRPFAAAFMAWALAQMVYANLRVVAVPLAFGLAFLTVTQASGSTSHDDESADPIDDSLTGHAVP
jgi:hypothetical protein